MELALAVAFGALVLGGAIAARPLKRWIKKCRRRRGGVYLVRTDHHRNRARRVNGYVGESVNLKLRRLQHLGSSRFDPATGKASPAGMVKIASQPWSDLNPRWYFLPLPWWLCWKWVLRPLETLVMLLTWPVYNDAKNHWNPRRIPKPAAMAMRQARDRGWLGVAAVGARAARLLLQVAGVVLVLVGLFGWAATR